MTLVLSEKMASFVNDLNAPNNANQKGIFEQLLEMDFPTTRNEYWKYTRLGKISNAKFQNKSVQINDFDISQYIISDEYIIIENGRIRSDLSQFSQNNFVINFLNPSEDSIDIKVNNQDVFNLLNASLFEVEVQITIEAKKNIEHSLQLIYVGHGENTMANNRLTITAEKSSSSNIISTFVSLDENVQFNNGITTINVAENAHFTLHKIQSSNHANLSVSTEQVTQESNSTFKINTFTFTGLLQRNNINIAVNGENCETYMNGAVVSKGKQHIDNHTFVDHTVSNCYSNENYKYVLDDQSTGVFNGRVVVRQDAQVINAYQNNGNILLSDNASINSKPELEIYADDVKCSHGSTTGQLDEDALFYLQARGIARANAKKLLVSAFIGEVIESVENENVAELIYTLLKKEHGWDF